MIRGLLSGTLLVLGAVIPLSAQTLPTDDTMLRRIWEEGIDRSQIYRLSQTLLNSLGPRLSGLPDPRRAQEWLVAT